MKRWLITILTASSSLLLVAAAALWVRSYFTGEVFYVLSTRPQTASDTTINVGSRRGTVYYLIGTHTYRSLSDRTRRTEWGLETISPDPFPSPKSVWRDAQFRFGGFAYLHQHQRLPGPKRSEFELTDVTYFGFVVPHWAVTLAAAVPTALLTARWRRQARRRYRLRHQLCPRCGYDLRAATGDRCPECGEAVPATGKAT